MKKVLKTKTHPLSNYEQNVLLPILVKGLKLKKGKNNAVTAKQIVEGLRSYGLKLNERHVCSIINFIRMNDLIVGLMGSSVGYYIISREQDFIKYEDSLLSRELALRNLRMNIKRQRRTIFTQLSHISQMQTQVF